MRHNVLRSALVVGPPMWFAIGWFVDDLATLFVRAFVALALAAVLCIGLAAFVDRLVGLPYSLEIVDVCDGEYCDGCDECDPDVVRPDPGAEWDRARDRVIDADLWPVIA